jgi:heavy metal sensor kinase
VATTILVLGVYAVAIFAFVSRTVSTALDQRLRDDFQYVAATIVREPNGSITWLEPVLLPGAAELPWVEVWGADGRLLFRNAEAERRPVPGSESLVRAEMSEEIQSLQPPDGPAMRVLTYSGSICPGDRDLITGLCVGVDGIPSPMSIPVVIQVARSEAPMQEQLRQLLLILAFGLPLAGVAAGFGGYTLARRALVPIERMTDRARHITAESLGERLPVHNPEDEMGRLATVFNETLGRLELSFEQMRRFTADVSHELRTPLTAIRSVGEVGLRAHRGDAEYRAIIGSMLEEADRLASLVDRLLTLSRAETAQARLNIEEFDLRELGENVASHLSVLAEEKGQTIVVEPDGCPRARGDRVVIRQALINLVDNAIKFSSQGGTVRIRVFEEGRFAVAEVVDTGTGVDAGARERIFDRFYRVPDGGETKGAGLGLSIARGSIEANGGQLTLAASGPTGSTFRMTLPRAEPAAARRRTAI